MLIESRAVIARLNADIYDLDNKLYALNDYLTTIKNCSNNVYLTPRGKIKVKAVTRDIDRLSAVKEYAHAMVSAITRLEQGDPTGLLYRKGD